MIKYRKPFLIIIQFPNLSKLPSEVPSISWKCSKFKNMHDQVPNTSSREIFNYCFKFTSRSKNLTIYSKTIVTSLEKWKINTWWRLFSVSVSTQGIQLSSILLKAFNSSRSWSLSSSFSKTLYKTARQSLIFLLSTRDLSCNVVGVNDSCEIPFHMIRKWLIYL